MVFKIVVVGLFAVLIAGLGIFALKTQEHREESRQLAAQLERAETDVHQLREQLKKAEGLVPDQAAVMTHVGYHFTNLWFAAQQENWPLADFYLGETRANVKWAVRAKPIRKGPKGEEIDLGAIAQALDNTNFTALKKAIDAKQKEQFATLYTETLSLCCGCHKASGKPYLRPQIPASPEVRIVNLDPNAKTPE